MIVKNEKDVIETCLSSVKGLIDYWVIFDTGSNDGTQETIKKHMSDIPGELFESKWVNFAHNRNEALFEAKKHGDYVLFIDADEILEFDEGFTLSDLDKDQYTITVRQLNAGDARRAFLVKSCLDWRWEGAIHEYLVCPTSWSSAHLEHVRNICNSMIGARSKIPQKEKYLKDAKVLEEEVKKDPNNTRNLYYLGMSYLVAEEYEKSIEAYEKRLKLPSLDDTETFLSICNLAKAKACSNDMQGAVDAYLLAFVYKSHRAEPLVEAAKLYRKIGKIELAYSLSKYALSFPYPVDDVCVFYEIYEYGALVEFANAAMILGKFDEGKAACESLLKNDRVPEKYRKMIKGNLELAKKNLQRRALF